MSNQIKELLNTSQVFEILDPEAAAYVVAMLIVLYVGKKVHDGLTSFNLNHELTREDNKAIALSFGGYLLGIGIILWGVLASDGGTNSIETSNRGLFEDLLATAGWSVIGIGLLQVARLVNDKILFYQFDNSKELVSDRNIGLGAVECGGFIGSALIIRAALDGEDAGGFGISLLLTLVYFMAGQVAFIFFGKIYQWVSRFDLYQEIEKDNVSAGVSFGMSLVAIGILLSGFIVRFESLIAMGVWFFICVGLLLTSRYIVDKIILPGQLLDEEISEDHNWGAALVEGSAAIGVALVCIAAF